MLKWIKSWFTKPPAYIKNENPDETHLHIESGFGDVYVTKVPYYGETIVLSRSVSNVVVTSTGANLQPQTTQAKNLYSSDYSSRRDRSDTNTPYITDNSHLYSYQSTSSYSSSYSCDSSDSSSGSSGGCD